MSTSPGLTYRRESEIARRAGAWLVFQGLGVSWDFSKPGNQTLTFTQSIAAVIR